MQNTSSNSVSPTIAVSSIPTPPTPDQIAAAQSMVNKALYWAHEFNVNDVVLALVTNNTSILTQISTRITTLASQAAVYNSQIASAPSMDAINAILGKVARQ